MSKPVHRLKAEKIIAYIGRIGVSLAIQQRIGAFVVIWGIFESNLENVLWLLKEEKVEGVKPTTEGKPAGLLMDELGLLNGILSDEAHGIISEACLAAKELADYRHAIMHGTVTSFAGSVSFIRNPLWHGGKRTKPTHDAHIDENLLDMAIDCAGILSHLVISIRVKETIADINTEIEALKWEVRRCRSQASELRHLADLMNHEKN